MGLEWGNIAQVFRDKELHDEFQEKGYVLMDFVSEEKIAALQEVYRRFHPEPQQGFYATTFNQDAHHRHAVDTAIQELIADWIQDHFDAPKVFFSSFITKNPDPKSELILHQDMTLVDESRFNGMNIWAPLVDLTPDNGPIWVLPGSHRLIPTYRGASLPDIYDQVVEEVLSYMEPMYLRAGQVLVFDQSILHYSPPNRSDAVRPVVNTFITHRDADIIICWADREQQPAAVERFRQADDFVINYANFGHDIRKRPSIGESLGWTPYDFPQLSLAQLEARYGPLREDLRLRHAPPPKSWWRKLLGA